MKLLKLHYQLLFVSFVGWCRLGVCVEARLAVETEDPNAAPAPPCKVLDIE